MHRYYRPIESPPNSNPTLASNENSRLKPNRTPIPIPDENSNSIPISAPNENKHPIPNPNSVEIPIPKENPHPLPTPISSPVEIYVVEDPGKRDPIDRIIDPRLRENVRRAYLIKGPYHPNVDKFPYTPPTGKDRRRFSKDLYDGEHGKWLEYSVKEDAIFCLYCYLFSMNFPNQPTDGVFVTKGFRTWKKLHAKLKAHVGKVNSRHLL